ncbi:MAG: hypothetical protein AAGB32_03760 [Pseudomonadota bacterium]
MNNVAQKETPAHSLASELEYMHGVIAYVQDEIGKGDENEGDVRKQLRGISTSIAGLMEDWEFDEDKRIYCRLDYFTGLLALAENKIKNTHSILVVAEIDLKVLRREIIELVTELRGVKANDQ